MLRLVRGARLQHVIVNSFPPRGAIPTSIWDIREIEPDTVKREKLQRLIEINGVSEIDFLRWRNACVAYDIKTAFNFIREADHNTPLWVTSHMLRRKIHNAEDASLAAHLALLAVPSSGKLAPAHEAPLILALEHVIRHGRLYALPGILSRILALPSKGYHPHLVSLLSSQSLTHSPIVTEVLQTLVENIMELPLMISRDLWLQVWERWGANQELGEVFSTWLQNKIREQGIETPITYRPPPGKTYTSGATYLRNSTSVTPQSSLASLTAAAQSDKISARLLLSIAHSLIHGFYPRPPDPRRLPDETFIAILIGGLVRRKAYSRAQAVWEDAERKISLPKNNPSPKAALKRRRQRHNLRLISALFDAGLSAYAAAGDPSRALDILDKYASVPPKPNLASPVSPLQDNPQTKSSKNLERPYITPSALNAVLPHLPPHAQHVVFSHSAQRWGIQPDSLTLEIVMQGALRAVRGQGEDHQTFREASFRENLREFGDGVRQLLSRNVKPTSSRPPTGFESTNAGKEYEEQLSLALEPTRRTRNRALIRQNAIDLFQSVILGNWPFIAGLDIDINYTMNRKSHDDDNILAPRNMALFVPASLTRRIAPKPTHTSKPKTPDTLSLAPLHPSPTPRFPNSHPTPQSWTAYLALLPARDLPEALSWMRAADESTRRSDRAIVGQRMFRPEKVALVDALIRWEAIALAGETLVERALHERKRGDEEGGREVGSEGALRAWLVEWLGPANVPSREVVARARLASYDLGGDS